MIRCSHCDTTINPGTAVYRGYGDGVQGFCNHACLSAAIAAITDRFAMMRDFARTLVSL